MPHFTMKLSLGGLGACSTRVLSPPRLHYYPVSGAEIVFLSTHVQNNESPKVQTLDAISLCCEYAMSEGQ